MSRGNFILEAVISIGFLAVFLLGIGDLLHGIFSKYKEVRFFESQLEKGVSLLHQEMQMSVPSDELERRVMPDIIEIRYKVNDKYKLFYAK